MKYRLGGQYRLPARRLPGDSKKMARQSVRDDPDFMAKLRDLERQRARNPVHNPERIAFEDKVADALAELRQVSSVDLAKEAAKNEAKAATYRRKSMELKKANPAADTSHYVESAKQYSDLARMQREAPEVIRASHQHMYKAARVVNTCLTDVDLLIEVVDDIIAQAKTIKRSGARPPYDYGTMSVHEQAIFDLTRKSNRHAKIEVIPKGPSLGDSEFFQEWVTSGKRLYDLNIDDSHGRTTHLIQDLMVDRAFRRRGIKIPGSDKFMTAEEYRRRLGDLVGLDPTGKHLGQRLWEYSYDAYLSLDDPNALFPVLRGKLPDLQ